MPVQVRVPSALRAHTDSQTRIAVEGHSVAQVIRNLEARYPALVPHLRDEAGDLRPRVNIYVNDQHVRLRQGLQTPVGDGDEVYITPVIMGG